MGWKYEMQSGQGDQNSEKRLYKYWTKIWLWIWKCVVFLSNGRNYDIFNLKKNKTKNFTIEISFWKSQKIRSFFKKNQMGQRSQTKQKKMFLILEYKTI